MKKEKENRSVKTLFGRVNRHFLQFRIIWTPARKLLKLSILLTDSCWFDDGKCSVCIGVEVRVISIKRDADTL